MMQIRRSDERGYADHGWLRSFHTFSFAEYVDPAHVDFGPLRVINEDRVQPGAGFGTHAHRDMEIVTYVLEGALAHRDSMGNGSVIRHGDVQRMSAGRGVTHSEFNDSQKDPVHFLQIWIHPAARGLDPGYEQRYFAPDEMRGRLRLIGAPDSAGGAVRIHQDTRMFAGRFDANESQELACDPQRRIYVHVARGALAVNGQALAAGDGMRLTQVDTLVLAGGAAAEVIVFDLP
jgi:redox-sensitive bicupin YhaK (pirin superfamily)